MRILSLPLILSVLILPVSFAEEHRAGDMSPEMSPGEVMTHIRYLSSDELEGRMAGEKGAVAAARYIAGSFKASGLEPMGDAGTYFQNFPLPERVIPGKLNTLEITIHGVRERFELGRDFFPLAVSASGYVSGELAFAGYGISAPELGYDDYKGLDVKGKVVLVLRRLPRDMDYGSHFYDFASLRYKAENAEEKGAKGIIFTTPSFLDEEDDLSGVAFELPPGGSGIEAVIMKRRQALELIHSSGRDLDKLESGLADGKNSSFTIPDSKAELRIELIARRGESSNVLGFVPGSDPVLRNEVIVIGAHYDHLGRGEDYSAPGRDKGEVYNGADDNASGVSGLLELSEYFADESHRLKRSLLFVAFSGEEIGLLGSSYYIDHPVFPEENTIAMINMDMIGRLRDNKLTVMGAGSSREWEALINKANSGVGLNLSYIDSAFGPSDQTGFFTDNIPAVLFFTGLHEDYHTPDDDWWKINSEGEVKVLRVIANLVSDLGAGARKIEFSGGVGAYKGPQGLRVYLGTIPDYSSLKGGVSLAGVTKGSPADKAGLEKYDTIIEAGGNRIENVYDYLHALEESRPGAAVELVILRKGKKMTMDIVPEPR